MSGLKKDRTPAFVAVNALQKKSWRMMKMIFRENGSKSLEIEFEESDTHCEKQVAYRGFEFVKTLLQLHREKNEVEK